MMLPLGREVIEAALPGLGRESRNEPGKVQPAGGSRRSAPEPLSKASDRVAQSGISARGSG